MFSGKFNKPLKLYNITRTTNSVNDTIESETLSGTVWASVKPLNGTEGFSFGANNASISHMIGCRYQSNILNNSYFLYGNRRFDIVSILNLDEENRELQILAMEALNQ